MAQTKTNGQGRASHCSCELIQKKHSFILCLWLWTQAECVCKWLECHCGLAPVSCCKPGWCHEIPIPSGGIQMFAVPNSKFPERLGRPEKRLAQEDSNVSAMICQCCRNSTTTMSKFVFQVAMPKKTDYHFIICARLSFLNCSEGKQKVTPE